VGGAGCIRVIVPVGRGYWQIWQKRLGAVTGWQRNPLPPGLQGSVLINPILLARFAPTKENKIKIYEINFYFIFRSGWV
jgi:hypothetical protein